MIATYVRFYQSSGITFLKYHLLNTNFVYNKSYIIAYKLISKNSYQTYVYYEYF